MTVSTNSDSGVVPVDDGILHLREAITYVNGTNPGLEDRNAWIDETVDLLGINDKIIFAPSLGGQTITLNEGNTGPTKGKELTITNSVIIDATMLSGGLTIAGTGGTDGNLGTGDGTTVIDIAYPNVTAGNTLTYVLAGLTITGGDSVDENGSIGDGVHQGGGITLRNGSSTTSEGQISLTIRDSVVTGNHTNGDGGGIYAKSYAGEAVAITIERSVISGNSSGDTSGEPFINYDHGNGGGIAVNMPGFGHYNASGSTFTITESVIEANEAINRGGGIFLASGAGGVIDIKDSTISGNKAGLALLGTSTVVAELENSGGGIYAYLFSEDANPSLLTITGTTIDDNTAGDHGGGIAICAKRGDDTTVTPTSGAQVRVINSTISGNQAGMTTPANNPGTGGGVHIAIFPDEDFEAVDAQFLNTTITDNFAGSGGGIWSFVPSAPFAGSKTNVLLKNTIVSGNRVAEAISSAANNIDGIIVPTSSYNLIGTSTATLPTGDGNITINDNNSDPAQGPIIDADNPGLLLLALNGGPTKTHAPNANSLVIDKGENSYTGEMHDQRGDPFDRVVGGRLDIGAVELQPLADFDHDSDVDGSDFLAWQRGFGTMAPNATKADGDADNDLDVDAADLIKWQNQYGLSAESVGASSSMQSGGSGSSTMMQSGTSSPANVGVQQAETQKIVPQLTPEEAAEKKEALFQLQKSFVEFLFKADLIQDVTEDGLIDRADLQVLLEPMLEVHPEIETDRLIREIQIPSETVASFDDALDELLGKEGSLSTAMVDSAVELL